MHNCLAKRISSEYNLTKPIWGGKIMTRVYRKADCVHCGKNAYIAAHGLCRACYQRNKKHGSPIYVKVRGICSIEGCGLPHESRGYCTKHYYRFLRHGHTDQTRSEDWGEKKKHPIYQVWMYLRRFRRLKTCSEWVSDFWKFYEDVGDRPSDQHRLKIINKDGLYEKSNVEWREIGISLKSEQGKEYCRLYSKLHRSKNREWYRNRSLQKNYGITLDQYNQMLDEQNGVCAICGEPEKAIHPNHNTNKPQPLAVDHCHKTGRIRGLLCSFCNRAIGFFKEDIDLLNKTVQYLTNNP